MVAYNKFNHFLDDVMNGKHVIGDESGKDTLMIYLSNTAPDAENDLVRGDCAEIASGNGYDTNGKDVANDAARSTTTFTLTGTKCVWTATPAAMATFRYVILYNSSSLDRMIAWWDYGVGGLTLNPGETFTVKFNNGDPSGTIFTFA